MTEPDPTEATSTTPLDTRDAEPTHERETEFAVFYRENTKPLVAFLILQGATLADATDIIQDTMTAAYQRWLSLTHPRAWAYRVASRALIRQVSTIREDAVAEPQPANPLLRATNIEVWEQHDDIARMLAGLPPRQRQVMAWTLSGYTPTEIADELHLTPEAVRSTLLKARRALTVHLRTEGDL